MKKGDVDVNVEGPDTNQMAVFLDTNPEFLENYVMGNVNLVNDKDFIH